MATGEDSSIQATTPDDVVNLFTQNFASVFVSGLEQSPAADNDEPPPCIDPRLSDLTLKISEVQDVLRNLDPNKATGPDGIPARILKATADVIAPSLTKLYNKSSRLGILPDEWKLANIVPVFKKDSKE